MKSKRILVLFIVMMLVMALVLVACDKKGDAPTPNQGGEVTPPDSGEVTPPVITWGEWEIVKAPTMEEAGEIKRTASDGTVESAPLPIINETNYKKTIKVEPTCEANGEVEYSVTVKDKEYSFTFKLDMLGHAWGEPTYVWSDNNTSCVATRVCTNDATHKETVTAIITSVAVEPTFEANGYTTYTATFDKDWATTQEKVVNGDGKHTLSKVEAVEPTVNSVGNIEYYVGTDGKYYDDANRTNEITLESTVIPKVAVTPVNRVEPQYGIAGEKAHYKDASGNKYTLGEDGTYVAVTSEELAIDELLGVVTIYVNGELQETTISHKKSEDVTADAIKDIIGAIDYAELNYYQDSAKATDIAEADLTAYAKASQNVTVYVYKCYTVTFYANGGTIDTTTRNIEYGDVYGKLPVPTRKNFVFNGWFSENGEPILVDDTVQSKAQILTADWYTEGLKFHNDASANEVYISGYTGTDIDVIIPRTVKAYDFHNVTSIMYQAFKDCTAIMSVEIPDTVTSIGKEAFRNCTSLESIVVDANNAVFTSTNKAGNECNAVVEKATDKLVIGCKTTVIPDYIETLGISAFDGCLVGDNALIIPLSVNTIEADVFFNCNIDLYVEAASKPKSWADGWNNNCKVYYMSDTKQTIILDSFDGYWHYDENNNAVKWDTLDSFTARTIADNSRGDMEITGYVGTDPSPVFPTKYLSRDIIAIADNAFLNNTTLRSVTVPGEYSMIGNSAFKGSLVDELIFEPKTYINNVIGEYAFEGIKITSLNIPNKTSIKNFAFANCVDLNVIEAYTDDSGVEDMTFEGCTNLLEVRGDGILVNFNFPDSTIKEMNITKGTIANSMIKSRINKLVIGKDVKLLGDSPIYALVPVGTIIIDDANTDFTSKDDDGKEINSVIGKTSHILYIGNDNGDIPFSVTRLGSYAFAGRTFSSIYIGNNITSLGMSIFDNCNALTAINFAKSKEEVDAMGDSWKAGIDEAILNGEITISYNAINIIESDPTFNYYIENKQAILTSYKGTGGAVTIPNTLGGYNVTGIGEIFKGNTAITSVVMNENVTKIGDNAFNGCTALDSIDLMNVAEIGVSAFNTTGLTSVDFKNVTYISEAAFQYSKLTSIDLKGVRTISKYAFQNTAISSLVVPYTVESVGEDAFDFTSKIGTDTIKSLTFETNPLTGKTNLKVIYNGGFAAAVVTSLVLPEGIERIGNNAFKRADVTEIYIPSSVKEINGNIFSGETNKFTSIKVDANNTEYTSRDGSGNEINAIIYTGSRKIYGGMYEEYTTNYLLLGCNTTVIPDFVAGISSGAFGGCTMKSIKLGANVEFIGGYAFYNCSELTSVDLSNTKIREISSFAFDATPKLTKVILPNSVSQLGRSVFTTQDLNIYCRGAEFDPGNKWYDTNKNITVTWNYTGE